MDQIDRLYRCLTCDGEGVINVGSGVCCGSVTCPGCRGTRLSPEGLRRKAEAARLAEAAADGEGH